MREWTAGISLAIALVLAIAGLTHAEELAPGVTYETYWVPTGSGSTRVYVVKIDRLHSEYKLKVGYAQGKRNYTARERTSAIASRYNTGPDHVVLSAVNGSFFDGVNLPRLIGISQSDGEMLDTPAFNPSYTYHTVMVGPARMPSVTTNFNHVLGTLTFPDGSIMNLIQYNFNMNGPGTPINNHVFAFTPGFDSVTTADYSASPSYAVEVILGDVTYPMRSDKEISGIVTALVNPTTGHNPIPAGGMVLSTWGSTSTANILARTQVGDRLRMRFRTDCQAYNSSDFALTGIGWIIHDGAVYPTGWQNLESGASPSGSNPRTVLAWNNDFWFQVVCDGRGSGGSVGMSFQQMADFLTGTLGALDAVNYDGGGSSAMVVNGTVKNYPSDGTERLVANAILLVKETLAPSFPFSDPFGPAGRLPGWDDKFSYSRVSTFSPSSPGGDGRVLVVTDTTGANTVRHGDFADTDYSVEADVYCDYRPGDAASGFERYGLFARDNGYGAFGLSTYGGGNCYALTYDSDTGRVQAGKYVNGTLTDFLPTPVYLPSTSWRRFRIDCYGTVIQYLVDGEVLALTSDSSHPRGFFGVGYHSFFATSSKVRGTRADNLSAFVDTSTLPPVAQFVAEPTGGMWPLEVQFTDTSAGGPAESWVWDFGDDHTSTDRHPLHTYALPGLYTVSLTVTGPNGSDVETKTDYVDVLAWPGDFDKDRDVDLDDFAHIQACLSGNGVIQGDTACAAANFDGDTDVDLLDMAKFRGCLSGANTPSDRDCLGDD